MVEISLILAKHKNEERIRKNCVFELYKEFTRILLTFLPPPQPRVVGATFFITIVVCVYKIDFDTNLSCR